MSLKYGKREISKIAAVLDQEHETAEDAAVACLKTMEEIFSSRAKFVVVGQLSSSPELSVIPATDPKAIRISLGWYSTEGDAKAAADSLWSSLVTGERFRVWVLPVHHGTPAEFHKLRKTHYEAIEQKARDKKIQDMKDWIEASKKRNEELAREWREGHR